MLACTAVCLAMAWLLVLVHYVTTPWPPLYGPPVTGQEVAEYYVMVWGLPAVVWLSVLAAELRRCRRSRCAASGFCGTCGYDLRATPDQCPACGATRAGETAPRHNRPLQPTGPYNIYQMASRFRAGR